MYEDSELIGFVVVIFCLLFFPIVTGWLAKKKNRSPIIWGLFGLLMFIVAFPLILLLPRLEGGANAQTKKCPQCAEWVKSEARICRFCQSELS